MKNKKLLSGLIAAPFTPMDNQGNIKLEMIGQYANHLIKSKISGAFICGTTGEGPSLTTEERKMILEEWIRNANSQLKIISHVGGNCLSENKELAAHAEKCGAYAIAAFAPSFFKPDTVKELISFLAPIAASAPNLPFYYYHIPSLTGVKLPVIDMLVEVEKMIPNFAGIKYTHFDLYDMQKCLDYNKGKYEILHGTDETLLCGLSLGTQAAVGSTYNYIPMVYLRMWEAYNNSDMESAREWQKLSVKIVTVIIRYGGGVRAGKAIMELIGIDCGPCRLPIKNLSGEELETFKSELIDVGFFRLIETVTNNNVKT
jgi:N-acetylneuraminate lyase